ncbi:semaphorin-5A isoform X2 [Manduca sexta]|uniref:semaphorin-5A isoform X2 n=1 Tax=Manduca sexta TaxID=7130 RepID=UPI00188FA41D|nr:semaphorin-5A isoform X2 [Manduca sexta]
MGPIYGIAAIILLAALSKGELPEDDFRIINRQDLLAVDSDIFEDKSSKSFSQLLFDVARDQLIVGARDVLYRLSLRGLRELERAEWPAPAADIKMCQVKGQSEEDCHNYVKVLLSYGHKIFACGTNAFSPICSWREIESINTVSESVTGVALSPYNPHSNVTAVLASNGDYYAGTPTDFSSSDTAICRSRGASSDDSGNLCTAQYDFNRLNEPQFVGSFEDDRFVYFVYREIAVEYMNCGKIIYSRIARVCKNDSGGYLMKDKWSTFLKARLKCLVPGDIPFYYDEIQSVEYLPQEKMLVATFTTPTNSITGSAVCVYNMSDIHAAFEGPYKVQDSRTFTWDQRSPSKQAREHFQCITDSRAHEAIEFHGYHLMYEAVLPISGAPIYKVTSERFTHVTVDVTSAKNIERQLVAFVATDSGYVLKLAVLPRLDGACLVEKWKLRDEKGGFDVQAMQFVKDTMSVYIGSSSGVVRLGAARCARHASRGACVGAADPHCGWDDARERCVRAWPHLTDPNFAQATALCVAADAAVDGGWSAWSDWESCMQDGTSHSIYGDDKPDMCKCRTRRCDNPKPANGGQACKGSSISVTNCTVHGGWSAWSAWSECSAPCGIAVKSRRRTCSSPEPRHGGRVCVGIDVDDIYCHNLPPCPDPALAPVDGGWSPWGPWSPCTSSGGVGCGPAGGMRERRRLCGSPAPLHGGADCDGPEVEKQACDMRPCEVRKTTAWTPWVQIPGNTSDGSYTEKRFKFVCKAPSPEQIKLSVAREEERYCTAHGQCSSTPPEDEGGWEDWEAWEPCSAPCGGGQQTRTRRCRRPPCNGSSEMLRGCNTHPCTGEWSCWSEWSSCSGSCGATGHRTRTRACLSSRGCSDAAGALERTVCVPTCAESEGGWGPWGAWGACAGGERVRRRACAAGACVGAQLQVARCGAGHAQLDNELYAMPAYSPSVEMASFVTTGGESLSVGSIVGCVVAAFVMGCLVCLAGVIFCQRRGSKMPWRRQNRVPSSPHYITAKQNSYVSVPLKEVPRKAKRQPSFSGIGSTSGILLSKSNNLSNANNHNPTVTTPKLYPKAIANEYDSMGTIRRHSNQPNNKNNLDIEEDKFY